MTTRLLAILASLSLSLAYSPLTLTTTSSTLPYTTPAALHRFLASPANWPRIVLSSHSVQSPSNQTATNCPVDFTTPLGIGESVDEIFGLPPVLPLHVEWTCIDSSVPPITTMETNATSNQRKGRLEFHSPQGVPGLACDCRMVFDIYPSTSPSASYVKLTMEYTPESPLAVLAVPALAMDNALALTLLLPQSLKQTVPFHDAKHPLDDFRRLMGVLYGVAGAAHFGDCVFGDSTLLTSAGCVPFADLSVVAQLYVYLWCAVGPLSFLLSSSRQGGWVANVGLVVYGAVEVLGAWLIEQHSNRVGDMHPLSNAVQVQVVVALAWWYSSRKVRRDPGDEGGSDAISR